MPAANIPLQRASLEHRILQLADQCVKCGLCLPHCPTYRLKQDENESPRGRIALLQGLAQGQLAPGSVLRQHIASCLDCRNCERVCPAGVRYERLLDDGRQLLVQQSSSGVQRKLRQLGLAPMASPARMRWLNRLLRLYQRSGLQRLARASGLLTLLKLAQWENLLPQSLRPFQSFATHHEAKTPLRGRVALFIGCLGNTLEQETIHAAITLLTRLGIEVDVVPGQGCCGALAMHNGETTAANQLAKHNLKAFSPDKVDAIVYCASGCGAQLKAYAEYPWDTEDESEQASRFAAHSQEITAFLAQLDWPQSLQFSRSDQHIAVHEPCSQRNALRQQDVAMSLLRRIPGLHLTSLRGNDQCCGSAGSYMLTQPDIAQHLRQSKLDAAEEANVDLIATINPGCALFLNAGLRGTGKQVLHPVQILVQHLQMD